MYILILLFTITFSIQGTISWLGAYAQGQPGSPGITARIAGEIHDADPANQKKILEEALKLYALKTNRPLTLHIEDPLAIHELSGLAPARGLLLGLTKHLQELGLPNSITIANFDSKKVANCAIHFLRSDQNVHQSARDFYSLTFGQLLTELDTYKNKYRTHAVIENMGEGAKKDCTAQLAAITRDLELLESNLTQLNIRGGDSIAGTSINLAKQATSTTSLYDPLYRADVQLTSLAAIVATFESKTDMALLAGERHAKDVSRILELERWQELDGPCSFTNRWLVYPAGR